SASVSTACTHRHWRAARVSMPWIAACACGLRTNAASSISGTRRSATKRPAPVSSGRASSRLIGCPIYLVSVTRSSGLQPLLEAPLNARVVVRPPFVIGDVRDLLVVRMGGHQFRQRGVEQLEGFGILRRVVEQPREHSLIFRPADEV